MGLFEAQEKSGAGESPCCTRMPEKSMLSAQSRGRGPSLQALNLESGIQEPLAESLTCRVIHAPGGELLRPDVDQASQEGPGGDHGGPAFQPLAAGQKHTSHPGRVGIPG